MLAFLVAITIYKERWTQLAFDFTEGPDSRSIKVTRPTATSAHTVNVQAYELQNWYTDGARGPASATSAVTSKVKVQGHV